MKRYAWILVLLAVSLFLACPATADQAGTMRTATGKVTSIDPQGKGIVVTENVGKRIVDVGAIIDTSTVIKVKAKKASINDIKEGDTVTIRYERSDDLYAKEIVKR